MESTPNYETDIAMAKKINIVIYKCYVKSFIYMDYLDNQANKIERFVNFKTQWKVIKEYNDGETDKKNPLEREKFKELCSDIMNNKLNDCKILVSSPEVIGHNSSDIEDFVLNIQVKRISLVFLYPLCDTADGVGTFVRQVSTAIAEYNNKILSNVFLFLSGNNSNKSSGNEYKCCFKDMDHLRSILINCQNDN